MSVHQYENFMFNTEELVLTCIDVLLDGDENIIPYCHLVREIKFIQFGSYLYVCGCTERSRIRAFVNEYPLRLWDQPVTEIMREYMAAFQVFVSLFFLI